MDVMGKMLLLSAIHGLRVDYTAIIRYEAGLDRLEVRLGKAHRAWNSAGGLLAGSLVGLVEAMYILGGASTGEYGALLYATILYGILGAGGGAGIGGGVWIGSVIKLRFADFRIYSLAFLGILCGLASSSRAMS